MGIQPGLWLAGLCFLGVTLAGCGPPAKLFVETTVHPDGSCDRLIWQPKDQFLPKQALQPAWNSRWKSVVDASGPHGTPGAHAREKLTKFVVRTAEELAKAPPKVSDTEEAFQYFIATGSFRSPLDIPPHYRFGGEKFPQRWYQRARTLVRTQRLWVRRRISLDGEDNQHRDTDQLSQGS